MRIIGGQFKGKKFYTFRGKNIRPTSDRLRESVFNILRNRIRNAIVLDLFAGTGALGIEALSRGARSAVFIDNSKQANLLIQRNIMACGLDNISVIRYWNIKKNLNCIRSSEPHFDLVFMDPPYTQCLVKPALYHLQRTQALAQNACIVVEHSLNECIPDMQPYFTRTDQRKYGKTIVSFLTYKKIMNSQITDNS
ncbi:16S rRNA (guanine(966)-N(2))-methyltransferase RsmD [Desulfococcaceae bacterium HSG9]|nr:16S rRNA (guanine(966)-N(2))-methyltransferase RsmD [Desulfococcaceae bacterium HSG9]